MKAWTAKIFALLMATSLAPLSLAAEKPMLFDGDDAQVRKVITYTNSKALKMTIPNASEKLKDSLALGRLIFRLNTWENYEKNELYCHAESRFSRIDQYLIGFDNQNNEILGFKDFVVNIELECASEKNFSKKAAEEILANLTRKIVQELEGKDIHPTKSDWETEYADMRYGGGGVTGSN